MYVLFLKLIVMNCKFFISQPSYDCYRNSYESSLYKLFPFNLCIIYTVSVSGHSILLVFLAVSMIQVLFVVFTYF